MIKAMRIGLKDLRILFSDRAGLLMMLLAPLALTLAMGFVTGSFSDGTNSGPENIEVVLVNQDRGSLGASLLAAFEGQEALFNVSTLNDADAARQRVEDDRAAAAIIIPAGFSAGFGSAGVTDQGSQIELAANPGRPISAGVVESIVRSFIQEIEVAGVSAQVIGGQMAAAGLPAGGTAEREPGGGQGAPIAVKRNLNASGSDDGFNPLAYFATGMAVFFLMYTVTIGGRSILAEREAGTLSRMLSSPTLAAQVLGGKVLGVFLAGLVQVSILIVASSLLFDLSWGTPAGVAVLVIAVVAAATGWGILLAASSKNAGQVTSLGTAMMLIFGMLGGTFISTASFGGLLGWLSRATPHRWALDGFVELAQGGDLAEIVAALAALTVMAALLFVLSVVVFRRRWASIV